MSGDRWAALADALGVDVAMLDAIADGVVGRCEVLVPGPCGGCYNLHAFAQWQELEQYHCGELHCPRCGSDHVSPEPPGPIVYRLYDAADRLLYVGSTRQRVARRVARHRRKPWGPQIARWTTERHDDEAGARAAELAAIAAETPAYNLVGQRPWAVSS